ncbi:NADH oxidase [Neolecta irregularis DAH-3]|uniref:NADH oxidase n=1 Tax=Neolecta irregularis (strain DAH-3) TaxID=1198029 RepID=A0A1U7LRI7_NEOID|nr:NADH oxidase [Neolecta irregularis DAH-3]|eukprot:OLL25162.1 NADH oxidase [Neolecta irregularis DAH-3]
MENIPFILKEELATWYPSSIDEKKRGVPNAEYVQLYERWSKGGIGLIVRYDSPKIKKNNITSGNIMLYPDQLASAGSALLHDNEDNRLEMFAKTVKVAKSHESVFIAQISHPGRQIQTLLNPNPVSAGDVQMNNRTLYAKPRPLIEIREIVEQFAITSELLYQAGFDGVQLHAAHGYLLAQFLSPITNNRNDKYGGPLANRSRIIFEIIDAIQSRCPPTFSISVKLNSVEFQQGGFCVEEAAKLCIELEKAKVDFIDLSGGNYENLAFEHKKESTKQREAYFLEFADLIRPNLKKTKIYVTGGFRTATGMVNAVKSGATDGIGLARPLSAEPELVKDILSGKVISAIKPTFDGITNMTLIASGVQIAQIGHRKEPSDFSDETQSAKLFASIAKCMAKRSNWTTIEKPGRPVDLKDFD